MNLPNASVANNSDASAFIDTAETDNNQPLELADLDAGSPQTWWKQAVVYQIYPRSFKDSTGSGLGDIAGITSKIDYLQQLGVDCIWLSPFYPSALADGGYDVADYRNVDPKLGTMADFDDLSAAGHAHGLKIVVDIVPNHSSNLHPWFQEALIAEPNSAARQRYIFRNGRGAQGELPPTDWIGNFGGSAWTRVADGQWYLHLFAKEQPDFNWDNRDVREDFIKTLRFWSDHGADGFRVDVAHGLAKDLNRTDLNDWSALATLPLPIDGSHPLYDRDEVHEIFRQWRTVFDEYDPPRFAVAEAWVNPARQYLYSSPKELGQIFNFEFAKKNWIRNEIHQAIEEGIEQAARSGSTSTWVMSNHDVIRHATRYALPQVPTKNGLYHMQAKDWVLRDGSSFIENRALGTRRSRAAIMLELALPGSAYVYQGEELGLFEVPDIPWNQLQDPESFGTSGAASSKGRDGCRVPLPWVGSDHPILNAVDVHEFSVTQDVISRFGHINPKDGSGSFGFSPSKKTDGSNHVTEETHLPQPDWYAHFAADVESSDPQSMLHLYQKSLQLRHELQTNNTSLTWLEGYDKTSSIHDGADGQLGGVIAYKRANGWASITNFGSEPVSLPTGTVILTSTPLNDDGKLPQDATAWIMLG
ncbi:glycoside hydrolase family 13 protein [Bifidobacterium aquikefiri]|uniref:glycoside hydrolase family 13 protein n=1 Tax=Bifidobacterium aquikefiri TaxID=1653207 RepID=UPI0023F07444|nr:glycoside hydrolase family 13 protein [Bifidobacterium aquikefiri]